MIRFTFSNSFEFSSDKIAGTTVYRIGWIRIFVTKKVWPPVQENYLCDNCFKKEIVKENRQILKENLPLDK